MGLVQSDLYECEAARDGRRASPDQYLARGNARADEAKKHNTPADACTKTWYANQADRLGLGGGGGGGGGKRIKRRPKMNDKSSEAKVGLSEQQQHIRKLSNVSNRNVQLLSMKPRSEKDTYADGLRSRRRSSLINLILGAPARGPRFSEDLCSLSSHMSELCNFGIDYFPDLSHQARASGRPSERAGLQRAARASSSINSSLSSRLNDSDADQWPGAAAALATAQNSGPQAAGSRGFAPLERNSRRRGSSLGSLTSFGPAASDDTRNDLRVELDCVSSDCANKPDQASIRRGTTSGHAECQNRSGASIQLCGHRQSAVDSDSRRAPNLGSIALDSVDLTSSLDEPGTGTSDSIDSQQNADNNRGAEFGRYYSNEQASVEAAKKTSARSPDPVLDARDKGCSQGLAGSSWSPAPQGPQTGCSSMAAARGAEQFKTVGGQMVSGSADAGCRPLRGRINHTARRMIHRSGSELSLYSSASSGCLSRYRAPFNHAYCPRHAPSIGAVVQEAGKGGGVAATGASGQGRDAPIAAKFEPHGTNSEADNDWSARGAATAARTTSSQRSSETKLIIMLQVCLPFVLAGFGNMGAGLALNRIAHWEAFRRVPVFFVLLPSFVGLKGNIEMTLASRLSTLSNLNLLDTSYQRRCALLTNLVLILSQAIGLSVFATVASMTCECFVTGKLDLHQHGGARHMLELACLVVLPAALVSATTLVVVSSAVMCLAIWLAKRLQVNPDNLSTLMAALYGDVSCVLTYGLFAQLMYSFNQDGVIVWPASIIGLALISWPLLVYIAYQCRETHDLALGSIPPMLAAIVVSLGSGAILSLVVDKFSRVALYQPVVNGFGANLIAVQASRVSTWLWCNALNRLPIEAPQARASKTAKVMSDGLKFELEPSDKMPYGSLASFTSSTEPRTESEISQSVVEFGKQSASGCAPSRKTAPWNLLQPLVKCAKLLLWSFVNPSPNAVAARLLLVMLIPAHSLYFMVIWLVAPAQYVHLTWPFYLVYISLCVAQVFVLLMVCQPLMTMLMLKNLDPDIYGISLLMALADLIGTICLTGGFYLLAGMNDLNAI